MLGFIKRLFGKKGETKPRPGETLFEYLTRLGYTEEQILESLDRLSSQGLISIEVVEDDVSCECKNEKQ